MKVALIGLGRWGQFLLKELKQQAEVKYECDSKTDLNQIFNDPEVEAVFIATPTETHFELAQKVLESGKHLFLEKPGTEKSRDLEKLTTFAREKNLKFAVGYEFTHSPAIQKLKELIQNEKTQTLFLEWQKWGTFDFDAVYHLLSHDVSIAKFLGFDTEPISSKKTKVISDTDILETVLGSQVKSLINRASPLKSKTLTITTDSGGYVVAQNDLFKINPESKELEKLELKITTPVAAEIADFLSAIIEKKEPLTNGKFALEVFKVIEQA